MLNENKALSSKKNRCQPTPVPTNLILPFWGVFILPGQMLVCRRPTCMCRKRKSISGGSYLLSTIPTGASAFAIIKICAHSHMYNKQKLTIISQYAGARVHRRNCTHLTIASALPHLLPLNHQLSAVREISELQGLQSQDTPSARALLQRLCVQDW